MGGIPYNVWLRGLCAGTTTLRHTGHVTTHYILEHVLHFISSLYRPDDDPDKGRNIVTKAKYIYTW
jgi:hypothetical protein